jgi:hypothetical protein
VSILEHGNQDFAVDPFGQDAFPAQDDGKAKLAPLTVG